MVGGGVRLHFSLPADDGEAQPPPETAPLSLRLSVGPAGAFPAVRRGQVAVFWGPEVQGRGLGQGGARPGGTGTTGISEGAPRSLGSQPESNTSSSTALALALAPRFLCLVPSRQGVGRGWRRGLGNKDLPRT